MRLQNRHEYKNYLGNRRIAVIQKASRKTYTLIQFVNNDLIDKKILEWENQSAEFRDSFNEDEIRRQIMQYNFAATSKDLQRILQHSLVTRSPITEMEVRKVLDSVGGELSKIEAQRVIKNLDYVENVLENANVNIQKYNQMIEKLPRQTSRKEVLERCIMTEKDLPPTNRQRFLERALERGSNYKGRRYTYKELNQLSRDLDRYKTHRLDFETGRLENIQADREGYDRVNVTKTWIWSQLEKTRHRELDGETVPFSSKFEVVNEVTGDVDYLLFPGDVTNDNNNCSNICNCGCTYEINKA